LVSLGSNLFCKEQPLIFAEIGEDDTRYTKGRGAGASTEKADFRNVDQLSFVYYHEQSRSLKELLASTIMMHTSDELSSMDQGRGIWMAEVTCDILGTFVTQRKIERMIVGLDNFREVSEALNLYSLSFICSKTTTSPKIHQSRLGTSHSVGGKFVNH
jgi:hypothetical protein